MTFDWPKQAAIGSDEFEGRTAQLLHRPGDAVAAFSAWYRRECQLNVRHCFNRLHQTAVPPPLTRCVASNTLSLSSTSRRYVIIAGFYLNAFFLEQACLSPAYVGIIQLVQGTWDTVNDPLLVNYFFISFEQMTEYLTH